MTFMGVKNLIITAGLCLSGSLAMASTGADSLAANLKPKEYRIGPAFFDARIIDSVQLRKKLILSLLLRKNEESQEMQRLRNLRSLRVLLGNTETWASPDEKVIAGLSPLLEKYELEKNLRGQSLVLNTYAVFFARMGEFGKSMRYFSESLALKERLGDKTSVIKLTENLACLASVSKKAQLAISYEEQLIALHRSQGHTAEAAYAYLDLAENQSDIGSYKDAEYSVLKKALPMFTRTGNKAGRLKCFEAVASLYLKQKLYSEAKWFFVQAHALAGRLDDRVALVNSLCKLAEVKTAEGYHEMALNDFREAEHLALRNNLNEKLVEIKAEMGEVYSQMGNYMAAGNVLAEYSRLREDLLKAALL